MKIKVETELKISIEIQSPSQNYHHNIQNIHNMEKLPNKNINYVRKV